MAIVILALLCLVAAAGPSVAQEPVPIFARIPPDSGLSQNSIYDIIQDRRGFLWVATSEGLNRYDGYRFVPYRHDPRDLTSLPDNRVQTLFEDRAGALWVGTASGAGKLDNRTGRFVRVTADGDRSAADGTFAVWEILEDRTGTLWLATSAGVCRVDPDKVRCRFYSSPQKAWRLHEDRSGTLWAFSPSMPEPYLYDRPTDRFVLRPLNPSPEWRPDWTTIHRGRSGTLWLVGASFLATADLQNGEWKVVAEVPASAVILEDSRGDVWLGGDDVYRYVPGTRGLQHVDLEASGPNALSGIRALYEDHSGTIWVGTLGGLYRWDRYLRHFSQRIHQPDNPNSLSSNLVSAMLESRIGALWVGTIGGGLNRLDPEAKRVTRFRHDPRDGNSLNNDVIWALHEDEHGALWIGTDDGLTVFDERTGRFRVTRCPSGSYKGPLPGSVTSIVPGTSGVLWLGLYGGRLARFDTASLTCKLMAEYAGIRPLLIEPGSTVLAPDPSGSLWVGVEGYGLQQYEPTTGRSRHYPFNGNDPAALTGRTVWAIHRSNDGVLWLGTDVGLSRFDPSRHSFTQVWDPALPSSVVYAIVEDADHRLWLSTNNGICAFNASAPPGQQFENFNTADGLGSTEFNRRAALRSRRGELFFGGIQGLTSFDPARILGKNPVAPQVVVTDVETRTRTGARNINPEGVDRVVLSHEDYSLTFGFVALNFTNPMKNRYAYKLEGFDPDWVGPSSRRIAQYTNVPPGTYRFRVKGSNNDGVWNEEGAALRVIITPPFWQRWWFRVLSTGAIVGLLLFAHSHRVRQVLAIERIRRQVATDLHDDIGSGLSQVAILSEVAKRGAAPAAAALMTETATLARAMRESLSDIVWAVDPRSDRLTDLVYRMRQVAVNSLESDGVHVEFRAPAEGDIDRLGMAPDRRRHLLLIFKEAITNIGRHAQATRVSIDLTVRGRMVSLTILDDGRGFDTRARFDGHGLPSIARRASELAAHLTLESTPGVGTSIRVDVPLG